MKIFSWMQRKLNAKQGAQKPNSVIANDHMLQEAAKDEFSDWPHGLLAIGTFGNNNLKEDHLQGSQDSYQDHLQDITLEELQKELKQILDKQVPVESAPAGEFEPHHLQLEKFFDNPSSLEVDRETFCDDLANVDIRLDNANNAIRKKSVSFLRKKMFLCRSRFNPTPSLRDSLPESRMEKILRAILHKKIYPHSSTPKATGKKYLENKYMSMADREENIREKENDGNKWVKTDSEFIVLEI